MLRRLDSVFHRAAQSTYYFQQKDGICMWFGLTGPSRSPVITSLKTCRFLEVLWVRLGWMLLSPIRRRGNTVMLLKRLREPGVLIASERP